MSTRREATVEEPEMRDFDLDRNDDPSLLRFFVDMRGKDLNSVQLRGGLMTMLIAGHKTTAAMLTWTLLYELVDGEAGMLESVQHDYDDTVNMPRLRYALIEALPPSIPRTIRAHPKGGPHGRQTRCPWEEPGLKDGVKILVRGTDIFISTWNLHRSPELWEDLEKFDQTRWEREFRNEGVKGWAGYNPDKVGGLYPNEVATDCAFLPFGGGSRKCVGDQFAMMEAATTMAIVLNSLEFSFATCAADVGMQTGATIHTMNGLNMIVRKRDTSEPPKEDNGWWEEQHFKRGLGANGRPYDTEDDAAWSSVINSQTKKQHSAVNNSDDSAEGGGGLPKGGCPVHQ